MLNAKKMVDWEGFSKAMASVLEFPEYYGDNWDAFMDLIRDLSWLSVPKLTILIYNSEYLFRSQTSDKQTFQECINEAGAFWKNPSENGGWEDDLPKPFHVILKSSEVISEFNAPKIDLISD